MPVHLEASASCGEKQVFFVVVVFPVGDVGTVLGVRMCFRGWVGEEKEAAIYCTSYGRDRRDLKKN